jgi:GT2 family glycosyltransferase
MKSTKTSPVSVVICCYTDDRWEQLLDAVRAVQLQEPAPDELIVVVDHNPALLVRAKAALAGVTCMPNLREQGLSGARNTGFHYASGAIVVFLDDDAQPEPGWLAQLTGPFEDPRVLATGGAAIPNWSTSRPSWFPREFDWVVGCSYEGLPRETQPVRNVLGCSMAFRRDVLRSVGGFREDLGRVKDVPLGCEETELCIRALQQQPKGVILSVPAARVRHHVTAARGTWRYFLRRCAAEGRSKARVVHSVGASEGLASERRYVTRTLPMGLFRAARDCVRGDVTGLGRALAIVAGLTWTVAGYAQGRCSRAPALPFLPVHVLDIELGRALKPLQVKDATGQPYRRVQALVRLQGDPIGMVDISVADDGMPATGVADLIWSTLGSQINDRLQARGLQAVTGLSPEGLRLPPHQVAPRSLDGSSPTPGATVVVATRDRPTALKSCLDAILQLDYPALDVVVVDNAPSSDATAELIRTNYHDRPVRYVREDVPGLASAHNRGLRAVSTPLVAFTDDDVLVDTGWLKALAGAFSAAPEVGCVTGMILPAELATPAQLLIEAHGRFGKGFDRQIFTGSSSSTDPLFPYAAGRFGSGANMAFRTSVLRELGAFDEALGTGSPGKGGDDLASFVAVLEAGYALVYEPAAIVRHFHHRDERKVRRQAFAYGVGFTAYLTGVVFRRPSALFDLVRKAPKGLGYFLVRRGSGSGTQRLPRTLLALELLGAFWGPAAYLRGRNRCKKLREEL